MRVCSTLVACLQTTATAEGSKMSTNEDADAMDGLRELPESKLLDDAYRRSGLTAADLAVATGLSVTSVRNALSGLRYRNGAAKVVPPPDRTVALLAGALGVSAAALRAVGRDRAAMMLQEGQEGARSTVDLESVAAIAGRRALARQILAVFTIEDLEAEIARREGLEAQRYRQEGEAELAEDLRVERSVL